MTECSGMCAPPRYGSLWRTTSPGSNDSTPSSSSVQRTMKRLGASWAGQNSAWPIMLPRRSKRTHEKSSPSLKIGEKAVRAIVIPISRQTFTKLLFRIVSVTGSIVCVLIGYTPRHPPERSEGTNSHRGKCGAFSPDSLAELQDAVAGELEPPVRRDDDRRVHRLHDQRPRSRLDALAADDRRLEEAVPREVDGARRLERGAV